MYWGVCGVLWIFGDYLEICKCVEESFTGIPVKIGQTEKSIEYFLLIKTNPSLI